MENLPMLRGLVWWALALTAWLTVASMGNSARAAERPNILLILADDMGYSDSTHMAARYSPRTSPGWPIRA
jgi:hypothetical protein